MAGSVLTGRGGGHSRPRRALTALALSILTTGCYAYTEVSPAAVPPGSDVRVYVARGSGLSVGTNPVPDDGRPIWGEMLPPTSADRLLVSVALGAGEAGSGSLGLRSTVSIPLSDVDQVEVRGLKKGRTVAAVGVGAFLAYVVTDWAFHVMNPDKEGSPPTGEDNARVVLFRLRW